jgi:adenine C2-methylase RlmN of 23S rRNA A2503 and tRNA A37
MVELRDAFLEGLRRRQSEGRRQTCTLMVAVTLMQNVNDSPSDAEALARLLTPIAEAGFKVCVDLIPYNDHTGTAAVDAATDSAMSSASEEGEDATEEALATPFDPLSPPGALFASMPIVRADYARVNEFQVAVRAAGLACFVRVTRGDDRGAACGQLATTSTANRATRLATAAAAGASP